MDRSTKPPVDHFLSTGVSGSNKYGLKDVIVPRDVIVKFLSTHVLLIISMINIRIILLISP